MIMRRCSGVNCDQPAISRKVRPQPMQSPLCASTAHTRMQGVSIAGAVMNLS